MPYSISQASVPVFQIGLNALSALLDKAAATIILPSALNDPAGVYTLRATDVVTGATAEAKITLK